MTSGRTAKNRRRQAAAAATAGSNGHGPGDTDPGPVPPGAEGPEIVSKGKYTLYELPDRRWLLCVLLDGEDESQTRRIPIPAAGAVALRSVLSGEQPDMRKVMMQMARGGR